MVEIASVVLCMKLLSALHLLQEWSPHQVTKSLMPLMTFVLILPCQQWIRHLGRSVLETWCPTDLHSGFALAWGGVWKTLRATLEAYGERHDRVLREKVRAPERTSHVSCRSSQDAMVFSVLLSMKLHFSRALLVTPAHIYPAQTWWKATLLLWIVDSPMRALLRWDSGECICTVRQ